MLKHKYLTTAVLAGVLATAGLVHAADYGSPSGNSTGSQTAPANPTDPAGAPGVRSPSSTDTPSTGMDNPSTDTKGKKKHKSSHDDSYSSPYSKQPGSDSGSSTRLPGSDSSSVPQN